MVRGKVQVELLDGNYKEFPVTPKTSGETFFKQGTAIIIIIYKLN